MWLLVQKIHRDYIYAQTSLYIVNRCVIGRDSWGDVTPLRQQQSEQMISQDAHGPFFVRWILSYTYSSHVSGFVSLLITIDFFTVY